MNCESTSREREGEREKEIDRQIRQRLTAILYDGRGGGGFAI